MTIPWTPLEGLSGEQLLETRLALHWAAQLPSAVGATLAEAQDDFSHTALHWDADIGALVGAQVGGRRAGLRLAEGELVVLGDGPPLAQPIAGLTLDEGLAFFADAFDASALERPGHDLPEHAVALGAPFSVLDTAAATELAGWYANAASLLTSIASNLDAHMPVRCWPHHFDLALSIPIDEGGGEHARSVGVGMTPGDGTSADPYFYVTPWPYPEGDLPSLPAGRWHREGWTGALLTAAELDGAAQAEQFAGAAIVASFELLGASFTLD